MFNIIKIFLIFIFFLVKNLVKKHPMKIRIAIVIILFTILIYNVSISEIGAAFKQARPWYLFYAIILMIPNLLMQFFKWHFLLVKNLNPRPSFKTAVISVLGGFFLGASTPGRTGELARGFLIPGHSKIKTASLTIVDKGFNQLITYLFGLTALSFVIPWPFSLIPVAVGILIITILLNIHRTRPFIEKLVKKFHRFTKSEVSEKIDNALAAFDALSAGTVLGMLAYSIPFYFIYTFQFYCIIRCYTNLSLILAMKTIPLIYFINIMLPIAIGNFGVKEMASVHVLGPFGIDGGPAFSSSLTQNVITFLVPSIIGGIVFTFYRPRLKQEASSSDDRKVLVSEK
ncbi:MAG TPA: flippase-like domain-containing protein [bacterium]|nr:flippase-like domain-containing protein [bacterium]